MRILIILFLSINYIPILQGQNNIDQQHIHKLFSNYNTHTPGASIIILKNGIPVYKKSFGLANLEYQIPITSSTIFNANSLSKQFVSFALYLLEKEDKISFEDTIQKYIPDFPEYDKPIKIKNLMSHTSGIRDQWGLLSLSGWRFDDFISSEHALQLIKHQEELNFEPNSKHGYSHSNYTLLAKIIEIVSHQTFPDFMEENVFSPLDMNHTFYPGTSSDIITNKAYSYKKSDHGFQKVNLNYQNSGPTNLMSSIDDLAKWVANFSNPKIGDADIIKRYNKTYEFNNNNPAIAAIIGEEQIIACKGQYFRKYKNLDLYSHGGSLGGFRGYIGRLPKEDFSIIMLSNDNDFQTNATALAIIDSYFKTEKEIDKKDITHITTTEVESPKTQVNLKKYVGEYYNKEIDSTFKIKIKNDKLFLSHKRLLDSELVVNSKEEFTTTINFPSSINFEKNNTDTVIAMKISNFGVKDLYFERKQ